MQVLILFFNQLLSDGRNFQVEYALKAVENAGTSIGIKCKDGVVFATEKIINSKLLVPGANKRLQTIDKHVGVVCRWQLQINAISAPRIMLTNICRLTLDCYRTADTLLTEDVTRLGRGDLFTRRLCLSPHLQHAWAATHRRTRFTIPCAPLVLQQSSVVLMRMVRICI